MINDRVSPIVDKEIEDYLANKELNLVATTDVYKAYKDAEFVIIQHQLIMIKWTTLIQKLLKP